MLGVPRISKAFRWLALPLALGLTPVVLESRVDAAPAKVKKKKKKKGPSMDDNAGQDVEEGGYAPGTKDSKSEEIEMVDDSQKKKKPGDVEAENVELEEVDEAPPEDGEPEGPPPPFSLNWLSLTVQQNAIVYGSTPGVCPSVDDAGNDHPGAGGYSCRDANGLHKGSVYAGAGNEVHGGIGLADLRFVLGYDRVLARRLMLGARFGFAILQSPAVTGTKAPMPLHGEGRIAYYFGENPFETPGFRPYVGFAVGIAEVDGKVSVVYYKDHIGYQNNKQGRLDVWRKSGPGFVAPSLGCSYPFGDFLFSAEARAAVMLGAFAFAPALAVSLSYGL